MNNLMFKISFFYINLMLFNNLFCDVCFKKVVIWGHPLHTHTHSYIHDAFYKAFKHLGYETYHLDNTEINSTIIDFSNSLFITEGQVDEYIPLRDDSYYIIHNCNRNKYADLIKNNRCIILQVFTNDVKKISSILESEPFIFEDIHNSYIYMPWATDLLPDEIEANKKLLKINEKRNYRNKYIGWNGTYSHNGEFSNRSELDPYVDEGKKARLDLRIKNGLSPKESAKFIQQAFLAPAIVGAWQKEKGYIPCRIFKNISLGQIGITNSKSTYELFQKKIVYSENTAELMLLSLEEKKNFNIKKQFELMDFVKNNHTYINRIHSLLNFFSKKENYEANKQSFAK